MNSQDDYIERTIAMLRRMLAQLVGMRAAGKHEQAMVILLQAQERLFGRPLSEVAALPLDGQLGILATGFSAAQARERYVCYALLLREAGISYRERDQGDLAGSAFKAALYVLLRAALTDSGEDEPLVELIRSTLASAPVEQVDAPIIRLLAAINP
jgi:hypothetical protein